MQAPTRSPPGSPLPGFCIFASMLSGTLFLQFREIRLLALKFDLGFEPSYGKAIRLHAGVARVTARNPGPFTFHGTNTYLVGEETLAIIDPGPDDDEHFHTLMEAIGKRPVSHIIVSHTHLDHSPLAARLSDATGAPTYGEGPHRPARPSVDMSAASGADMVFVPDFRLSDGQVLKGGGWALTAVLTPGHAATHVAFALKGTGILFSGDHVMGWSTTIVAPPDGSMSDYMASLDKLIERGDRLFLPGHGGPIEAPGAYMEELRKHRLKREEEILGRLRKGDRSIRELVGAIYRDIDPQMHGAAGLSVLAHLEDLVERGLAETDGPVSVRGIFRPL